MSKIILGLGIFVIMAGSAFFVIYSNKAIVTSPDQIACTMDAKLCPDGSYVGRSGPKCEFKECSVTVQKEGNRASLNERILNKGVFIAPLEVVTDSRCPVDVTCIWAGEVSLKVKLETGGETKITSIVLGKAITFRDKKITLTNVAPIKESKKTISPSDYRFTFSVSILPQSETGKISGTITIGPTCPVERNPPDPACAPRLYSTKVEIHEAGKSTVIKTIDSNVDGGFSTILNVGSYDIIPKSGAVFPRCGSVTVKVLANKNTVADISCDSGIR